jgi:hypothetical protein
MLRPCWSGLEKASAMRTVYVGGVLDKLYEN